MEVSNLISHRLRALREERNVTQSQLSAALGFNDRQTLSKIESVERRISAEELVRAAKFFDVPLDYFTDPFRLDGEARFSWRRRSDVERDKLEGFEFKAARWIALYRELAKAKGHKPTPVLPRVSLHSKSSFEEAWAVGEAIAQHFALGDVPSSRLLEAAENLGALVLYVDAIPEVSGAACQLSSLWPLNVILVNRNETAFRRSFDLAHELFHLLTWDALPPNHFESFAPSGHEKRIEQLAENFAAAVLMPEFVLAEHLKRRQDAEIHSWLNATATTLVVSSISLKHRLSNAGLISRKELASIDETKLKNNGQKTSKCAPPPLFSRRFMETIQWGISEGEISVRRACAVLDMSIDALALTFKEHDVAVPFEL